MHAKDITSETTVGQVAVATPLATRVFQRHDIDFCCGGGRTLAEACAERDLDVDTVLAELREATRAPEPTGRRWEHEPLEDLIEHILAAYHRPLDEELPRIEALARKVHQVHAEKDPERLGGILRTFGALKAELEMHMMKEERILFPMILQGHGAMAQGPVHVMRQEHDDAGAALRTLRRLTDDFAVPAQACNTWRALWHALADFERAMHEHIHLENNVLFPRALEG
jgi:regulator of cell morphogenesis and NO signaling